jgi:2-polyprenyl-3-methyl-5-hydroxy-6-metoxy-1,4-benzoquinol methylase
MVPTAESARCEARAVSDWTTSYFDTFYLRRWRLGLPSADVRANAEQLLRLLEAEPGRSLLDIGCGQGRYDIAFAERGMRVTGVDASEVLLAEARRLAVLAAVAVDWQKLDMRQLAFEAEFDHVVLIDAFGFFKTPEEDRSVLAGIAEALQRGGTAALVMVNGQRILRSFRPSDREEREGLVIETERSLEPGDVLVEQLTFRGAGEVQRTERRQRLYRPDALTMAVRSVGLRVEGLYGDIRGRVFDSTVSEKMVLTTRRG